MQIKHYIQTHSDRYLEELKAFLRIQSISADKKYAGSIEKAADFLIEALESVGIKKCAKYYEGGNPIVFGERIVDLSLPTVLIYGHYDVQPADPIDLWHSDPFEPIIKDEKIYARGACDDKAQVYLIVKAIEILNSLDLSSCNIKIIFEGEEEIGSVSLERFVKNNLEMLQSDTFLVCDTAMQNENQPTLITSLRGILYAEIEVTGVPNDLHSGMLGGPFVNAIQVLCDLISKLKDQDNRILIPGFYDDITPVFDKDYYGTEIPSELKEYIIQEHEFSVKEQIAERPTLDIHGIQGGYNGEGPKTIVPSFASAKLSMRLVEGQDHNKIYTSLLSYLHAPAPAQVQIKLKKIATSNAVNLSEENTAFNNAKSALKNVFHKEAIAVKIGGTIPVVSMIKELLQIEPILMGFGLDSDNIHAPNESFSLSNFYKGIETLVLFFQECKNLKKTNSNIIKNYEKSI